MAQRYPFLILAPVLFWNSIDVSQLVGCPLLHSSGRILLRGRVAALSVLKRTRNKPTRHLLDAKAIVCLPRGATVVNAAEVELCDKGFVRTFAVQSRVRHYRQTSASERELAPRALAAAPRHCFDKHGGCELSVEIPPWAANC